ncbi:MAG: Zn-ribbon domain-containing OB-fold protein [Actinobacteria bacterium]|nr:Zn-ribbon domain-containing OB-fold protein [Actinomycetota bacterium]
MTTVRARSPRSLPTPVGLTAEWYSHCARGELRFQRCGTCGAWRHPPRHLCPACGDEGWSWDPSSGRGTLFSWTVTHQALHPGFADALPYAVLVVELEEGVRVVAGLRGIEPGDLRLGLPVEVEIERVSDTIGLLYFRRRPA